MEESQSTSGYAAHPSRVTPLSLVLGLVFVFFCGILVFVFVAAKRANPVMLDQQGRPLHSSSQPANSGQRQ